MTFYSDDWLKSERDPSKLPKYARRPDRWDLQDWRAMLNEIKELAVARDSIKKTAVTGDYALADSFWEFIKVDPELEDPQNMNPAYIINRIVAEEMEKLDETKRLRRHTMGDTVGAAQAAISIEPDLETLFDKIEKQRQAAEELAKKMQNLYQENQKGMDLDDLMERWREDNMPECTCDGDEGDDQGEGGNSSENEGESSEQNPGGNPGGNAGEASCPIHSKGPKDWQKEWDKLQQQRDEQQKLQDQARQEAQQAGEAFNEAMQKAMPTVRVSIKEAMEKAAERADVEAVNADAWGLEPGELQRLPAAERIALAKRLDNPRFRKIAERFGAMKNLMLTEVSRRTIHSVDELHEVVMGSDLDRILPEQLADLRNPITKLDFLRRFAEGELLEYNLRGEEKLAQGGILYCEDGSGSMGGDREIWGKAICLCLLHLARMQKRTMHVIHFSGPGQYKLISFTSPEDFRLEKILDVAETYFGGGTCFMTPMKVALGILQDEHRQKGAVEGDIVFATDGMCGVDKKFMKDFKEEQERLDFAFWGINIGGHEKDEPLYEMADGKVFLVKDLLSGNDVRGIFRGMG